MLQLSKHPSCVILDYKVDEANKCLLHKPHIFYAALEFFPNKYGKVIKIFHNENIDNRI